MSDYYILKDKKPVPVDDVLTWAAFTETANRHVANESPIEGVQVSTVFLGIDHRHRFTDQNEPPILFETMIFGGKHDGYQERYCTWEEAEEGHKKAVAMLFEVE